MKIVNKMIPSWLQHYQAKHLSHDVLAGVIFTILVIPQSLAYALLAGLPPHFGLYVSIFPVLAYIIFGSSMVQAVGPVAITAIMTYSILSPMATPGSSEYIMLSASLALFSGLILLLFGWFRLGFLSQLLSRPVMSGFISGSAVLIIISQLKSLLGISYQGQGIGALFNTLTQQFSDNNYMTMVMGLTTFLILILSRTYLASLLTSFGLSHNRATFIARLVPLVIVFFATVLVVNFKLDVTANVTVVGHITEGLPGFEFFLPGYDSIKTLAMPALLMALIGMVQGISIAESLAIKRRERIKPNAELVGLGTSNIVAAFYGGMPVGGGVSRSAVNVASGAQTPLAGIVSAFIMMAIVAGASHWLARLPLTVLAANIMVAAISMVDFKSFKHAWSYDKADGLALLGTAGGVILLGLESGIVLGVTLSLATLLYRASIPHIAVIGRIAGTEHFRNIARHHVETIPNVLLIRIDESLFFGNLNAVEARLSNEISKVKEMTDLVLVMNAVNRVDTTAMEVLNELNCDLLEQECKLHLAEIKGPVYDKLKYSPLLQSLSGEVFFTTNKAFETLADAKGYSQA